MTINYTVHDFIGAWATSPFANVDLAPWHILQQSEHLIRQAHMTLHHSTYHINEGFAVHESAHIENGVVLKRAGIIGPRCFVATGAYLRGGTFLGEDCIIGPGSELKTCFMFHGSKVAHLNFVGDSLIGSRVNIEAGAVVANYRNELVDKTIRILYRGEAIETGVDKFGCLIGDNARIGANAVIAPGALIEPDGKVGRLQLLDQYPY